MMIAFNRSQKFVWLGLVAAALFLKPVGGAGAFQAARVSVELENLTWVQAEEALRTYGVVLIALGARTKEHGLHLPSGCGALSEFLPSVSVRSDLT